MGNHNKDWKGNLSIALECEENKLVLEEQCPPIAWVKARARWMMANSEVHCLIVNSMIHT